MTTTTAQLKNEEEIARKARVEREKKLNRSAAGSISVIY
jgi:hypothetical protein